jgi:hypothetical protein
LGLCPPLGAQDFRRLVRRSFPACGLPVFDDGFPILGAQIQADGLSAFLRVIRLFRKSRRFMTTFFF